MHSHENALCVCVVRCVCVCVVPCNNHCYYIKPNEYIELDHIVLIATNIFLTCKPCQMVGWYLEFVMH